MFAPISDTQLPNYIRVDNLPAGLTPVFDRIDHRTITVGLNGNASNHQNTDSINDVSIVFTDTALFTNGVIGNRVSASLQFFDLSSIVATGRFTEIGNSGQYAGKVIVKIEGDQFDLDYVTNPGDVNLRVLPQGLRPRVQILSRDTMEITLLGTALSHSPRENRDLQIEFSNPHIFESHIAPSSVGAIPLINADPPNLTVSGSFIEADDDIGVINSKITLSLSDEDFKKGGSLDRVITVRKSSHWFATFLSHGG